MNPGTDRAHALVAVDAVASRWRALRLTFGRGLDTLGWALVARVFVAIMLAGAAVTVVALMRPDIVGPSDPFTDASNYFAAADRLLNGGSIYSLSPGDRPVPAHNPPYWSVPLLSPPGAAIVWLLLSPLPPGLAMTAWTVAGFVLMYTTVGFVVARAPLKIVLLLLAITYPVAITAWSGNLNTFLYPGFVAIYLLWRRGRTYSVGAPLSGLLAAVCVWVKITPIFLAVWIIATGGRRAAIPMVVGLFLLSGVSLLVVGPSDNLAFLQIAASTGSASASPWSLVGLVRTLGLSALAEYALALASVAAVTLTIALRRKPRSSFVVAVVAATLLTPAMRWEVLSGLMAVAAPWMSETGTSGSRSPKRTYVAWGATVAAGSIAAVALLTVNVQGTSLQVVNSSDESVIVRMGTIAGSASIGYIIPPKSEGFAFEDQPGRMTGPIVVLRADCEVVASDYLVAARDVMIRVDDAGALIARQALRALAPKHALAPVSDCTAAFGPPIP